ncbi:hypothetical protein K490DRAFT_47502 [Saccharata proteae CBS 121410]|uniref:t-SNARE coiled-coil homology domain-containing protein n=1 Tax=Saccharata proteae CBS 121410 TaxID=1314787 RepID=A0A9P4LXM9_9PEZI|nr:hypothetical protein K490DRAFT_47502 [Saccharata proteae CBS 121410]
MAAQLFLLADHIKLSLLERQRATSLNLPQTAQQDGQISRSLDSLRQGLDQLESQIHQSDDEDTHDQLAQLRTQYASLSSQFTSSPPPSQTSLTTPNDPTLSPDFAAAQRGRTKPTPGNKAVRFRDSPSASTTTSPDPSRAALFPYRDFPDDDDDDDRSPDHAQLDNTQIHAYHKNVLSEQDAQLDTLSASITRQRELSIQIGDELDDHALMLDEVDEGVDRHQSQLDRARGRLGKVARGARDNWSLTLIVVLIVVLVLLIAILK